MEYYFLGTGAGIPSLYRNVSSAALLLPEYNGDTWLFDCGEGTQHQILSSPIKLSKLTKIFITHLHGDHLFGLPGVLGSRSFLGCEAPLTVYGPKGIRPFVEVAMQTSNTYLKYPLEVIEIEEGMTIELDHFKISVRLLDHIVPSYGYRIEEKEHPGELQVDKLLEAGIPPGPIYREIKEGKTITLPDGRVIHGSEWIAAPKQGKKLAVLGDTKPTQSAVELAEEVDLLIHESTFRRGLEERAEKYYHSTNIQAAQVAKQAKAKRLILTHISSRYNEEGSRELLQEAREIFPHTWIASDGSSFPIE